MRYYDGIWKLALAVRVIQIVVVLLILGAAFLCGRACAQGPPRQRTRVEVDVSFDTDGNMPVTVIVMEGARDE